MKPTFALLGCLTFATGAVAAPQSPDYIRAGVADAVSRYANAVACPVGAVAPAQVLTLVADTQAETLPKYAVLWSGDMGCFGGSGSEKTQLAIATYNTGRYVVQPQLSTPSVAFDSPVRFVSRVVGAGADTLVLEGKEYGPNDPQSTPSIPVRFTLRADDKGNWRLVDKVRTGK